MGVRRKTCTTEHHSIVSSQNKMLTSQFTWGRVHMAYINYIFKHYQHYLSGKWNFAGFLSRLRKIAKSDYCLRLFCTPVWPSVLTYHISCHWNDFHQISYLSIFFQKSVETSNSIKHWQEYWAFYVKSVLSVCLWRDNPQRARASSFTRFLDLTQRRTTVGRTPLDEWSASHRDLCLTTHTLHEHLCIFLRLLYMFKTSVYF